MGPPWPETAPRGPSVTPGNPSVVATDASDALFMGQAGRCTSSFCLADLQSWWQKVGAAMANPTTVMHNDVEFRSKAIIFL